MNQIPKNEESGRTNDDEEEEEEEEDGPSGDSNNPQRSLKGLVTPTAQEVYNGV